MSDAIGHAGPVGSGSGAEAPERAARVTPNSPVAGAARVQPFRMIAGGQIERRPLSFGFDGKQYQGFAGDTLASALLANGVRLVGRSFKYHRPRGILSAGPEEPNALVELRDGARREPNTRATVAELYDGLVARSQNRWPSLRFDLMAVNSLAAPILGAGFYYKTFMWPAAFWEKVYEPMIRRAAGLGRAAGAPDPDLYEKATAFCDVLVVGGGPAGLAAALAAGRSGARVILATEDFVLGGRLVSEQREIGGQSGPAFAASVEAELASLPEVRILRRAGVFGVYDGGTYAALERVNDHVALPPPHEPRQRLWRIVAKRCVLAAGAIERPVVFADNDRPGVMLAGAVRTYLNRFAVRPGSRAVLFGNNDDALRTARDLQDSGVTVAAVVDPRPDALSSLDMLSRETGTRLVEGVVERALGSRAVQGAEIRDARGEAITVPCDLIAVSGGWQPTVHLTSHLGGRPEWASALASFVPGTLPPGMAVVGAARGDFALASCLADGIRAGSDAAAAAGFHPRSVTIPSADAESTAVTPLWRVKAAKGKAFVDFQNDVSASDVEIAHREGFVAVEHLKRYTTLGMATDQGKTANVNGLALMAELTGRSVPATGTTRFRPPFTPVAFAAFAGPHRGKNYRPTRLTAAHGWAVEHNAVFMEAGLWLRAQYFPHTGDKGWRDACDREVLAVRERVGLCDVSTLGKIEVVGTDAGTFLDRLYTNTMSSLPVGRVRYGIMLREDGFVMDDGTAARLEPQRYLVTTTTANAVAVMSHMEFAAQVLWPDLDVALASVTDQWAQFAVAGPRSRDVLAAVLRSDADLANEGFPFMGAMATALRDGTPARLFRISFSGELAYEIAVAANYGDGLARTLMAAGAAHGIMPYGLEALNVLRIEKGHAATGELNGQTTAGDLGLGRMVSTKKDFVGAAMTQRPALVDPDRWALVGFRPVNPQDPIGAGAHLLRPGAENKSRNDEGHVTSTCFSPTLGSTIALGLLRRGPQRLGERVRAYDPVRGRDTLVEVCAPVFVDPEGVRLRG
jgi:sarcosine oxidase subunit alpha